MYQGHGQYISKVGESAAMLVVREQLARFDLEGFAVRFSKSGGDIAVIHPDGMGEVTIEVKSATSPNGEGWNFLVNSKGSVCNADYLMLVCYDSFLTENIERVYLIPLRHVNMKKQNAVYVGQKREWGKWEAYRATTYTYAGKSIRGMGCGVEAVYNDAVWEEFVSFLNGVGFMWEVTCSTADNETGQEWEQLKNDGVVL